MMDVAQLAFHVCVKCVTYCHARYIVETMNGFTIQQTGFPFICVIVDDASKDGEQDAIIDYLRSHFNLDNCATVYKEETADYSLVFAQHASNVNCYFAVYFLKFNHYSIRKSKEPYFRRWEEGAKYIALCDGDDYWTTSHKLQSQVAFLERNEGYGLCYTSVKVLKEQEIVGEIRMDNPSLSVLLTHYNIPTLSLVFRKDLWDSYVKEIDPESMNWLMGDYPLALYSVIKSKVGYIEEFTGVYRILNESASHSRDIGVLFRFWDNADDILRYFINKFIDNQSERSAYESRIVRQTLIYKLGILIEQREYDKARILFFQQRNNLNRYNRIKFYVSKGSYTCYSFFLLMEKIVNRIKRSILSLIGH